MISTGTRVDAETGLRIGLVQEFVERGEALPRALECARQIAEFPQPGLVADRRAVIAGADRPLGEGLDVEAGVGRSVQSDPEVTVRLQQHQQQD